MLVAYKARHVGLYAMSGYENNDGNHGSIMLYAAQSPLGLLYTTLEGLSRVPSTKHAFKAQCEEDGLLFFPSDAVHCEQDR